MAGNSFGNVFRLSTFGESHGPAVGGIIDGCPAGLELSEAIIQQELNRRKPGQSSISTPRTEDDLISILSGVFEGKTLGTPIGFVVKNKDAKSKDYSHIKDVYRPSHADFTWQEKFGRRDYRGGGRASARETVSRVVGGAVAKQLLNKTGVSITSYVSTVGNCTIPENAKFDLNKIDSNLVRCPHKPTAHKMLELIESIRNEGDSIGGIITLVIKGVPVGWGEPVFDKLHAELAKALFSINAVKGVELGSGFESVKKKGSELNDIFEATEGGISTKTNNSGGIQGGISNGQDIVIKVAFKPVATIYKNQTTVNREGKEITLEGKGRHDPCVLPRAVPIVDAMAAMVLADYSLLAKLNKL